MCMAILGVNPLVEEKIIEIAKRNGIVKVIVFGSRARGDYKRVSDIDLAISGGNCSAFSLELDEDVPTLLELDIVNLDGRVQRELLETIKREGKIIYEKV